MSQSPEPETQPRLLQPPSLDNEPIYTDHPRLVLLGQTSRQAAQQVGEPTATAGVGSSVAAAGHAVQNAAQGICNSASRAVGSIARPSEEAEQLVEPTACIGRGIGAVPGAAEKPAQDRAQAACAVGGVALGHVCAGSGAVRGVCQP